MSNSMSLPVILVSAKTIGAACKLISEIIQEEASTGEESNENDKREWVIENKYYTARVAVHAVDDEAGPVAGDVEAHVVLLQAGEGVAEAARRLQRAPRPPVAVLAVDADRVPPALEPWCLSEHIEPVELRPCLADSPESDEPYAGETGVRRVREALHAHVWPGLRRHRAASAAAAPEDVAVEDEMERFAAAAAALEAAARLTPAERRARADDVILMLSRALRIPLDDL